MLEQILDQSWSYDDPAGTEQRFRSLMDDPAHGPAAHAEILTQIARAQGLQRRFDEAHRTLDEVRELLDADPGPARLMVRYLLERGRVLNSSGAADQACPLFQSAWELSSRSGEDFYTIDAAHMLGIAAPANERLDWNLRALTLAEQTPDERARRWCGSLYNNIGWTYHDRGEYDQALDLFQRALAWREAQGDPGTIRIARWCVARTMRSLGRIDEALELQRTLLNELAATGEQDGYVQEELGECTLVLNGAEAARPFFAAAYAVLARDEWLAANEPARLARLRELGGV